MSPVKIELIDIILRVVKATWLPFLFKRRWRGTVRSRFMPTAPSSCGKIFVLPTSQFQNAIAHFGLLRRTLLAQIWRDTLRRRFFEHSECYRKNCLTRDFGRPQGLSRHCGCVGELRSISLPEKNKKPYLVVRFFIFGGDGEIRTLELRLTVTRFPIVRPRPD